MRGALRRVFFSTHPFKEGMNMKHLYRLMCLVIMTTVALTACGTPAAPTAVPQPTAQAPAATSLSAAPTAAPASGGAPTEVFKLGVDGPFSGPSALTGNEFKASVTMALEKINSQIGKYKIEPVWIDDQSDPAKGTQAYEQAVAQDKIQAGILNWNSSVAVALMDVVAKYKVPHFFGFGATELVNEKFASDPAKYGYWMNKGWPTPSKLSISYVQAVEDAITTGAFKPGTRPWPFMVRTRIGAGALARRSRRSLRRRGGRRWGKSTLRLTRPNSRRC
jgi:hypothetical protein